MKSYDLTLKLYFKPTKGLYYTFDFNIPRILVLYPCNIEYTDGNSSFILNSIDLQIIKKSYLGYIDYYCSFVV